MASSLTVETLQQPKSRSVSKNSSINSLYTEGSNVESGYMCALQECLLAECANLTKDSDWQQALVLEIGCGCGDTTRQLSDRLAPLLIRGVLGIDTNQDAIDYAFSVHADEKTDFATANVEDLNTFELKWGGRFDWLFSSHALLFVKDQPKALRNLMWCLRPGGRCFIATIPELVADMADKNFNRLWFHHPQADRIYSALLEQVGYEVLKTKQLEFKYNFASTAEYKGSKNTRRSSGSRELTPSGRVRRASLATVCGWVLSAWAAVPRDAVVRSFAKCTLDDDVLWDCSSNDGSSTSEDDSSDDE
ncbi:hypothetical protein HPB51_024850 [Rhipicephalus microplus]|uniref:Methyltransferase domain-containing protein n=1 Tax=Rhipicephalus microplus TaxID=6941 RepID=A0A9J6F6F7_RHIMP|nr:hypothetical protein HPB51_024850 [Rhipicephalus microplus]